MDVFASRFLHPIARASSLHRDQIAVMSGGGGGGGGKQKEISPMGNNNLRITISFFSIQLLQVLILKRAGDYYYASD